MKIYALTVIILIYSFFIVLILQHGMTYAQFEDEITERYSNPQLQTPLISRNNLSILCLLKETNTDGIHEYGGHQFRYEYEMKDFVDKSDWIRLLDFRPLHTSEMTHNKTKWNQISKIIINLKGKRGIIVPSEIVDKKEIIITLSSDNILRRMEIILKNICITLPLIPETPPEYIAGAGLMGIADLRTYDVGQLDIFTVNGNFSIRLSFPLKIKSSGSTLEYPFFDLSLATFLDTIIHRNTGKHLPRDVFDSWSGKERNDNKLREVDNVTGEEVNSKNENKFTVVP
jgi:hypothetical protein